MQPTIEVTTADFAAAEAPYVLKSSGIGSCVVVCFYDASAKRGALAHIMLPKHPEDSQLNPLRFADLALPMVVDKLEQMGSSRQQLNAQIIGGASMFQALGSFVNNIGGQNVAAVQAVLEELGVVIARMDVGGNKGRSVTFRLDSGDVEVNSTS